LSTTTGAVPRRARQERSRVTEAKIISAATELFLRDGYAATTMAAIAAGAEVSVQSLYLRFAGKLDILAAALDVAIVGDTQPVPLLDRPWFARLRGMGDGPAAVRLFVRQVASILVRSQPLYAVVLLAGDEARELLAANKAQRHDGVIAVGQALAAKPGFASARDARSAADLLYALLSEEQYGLLVGERGWTSGAWRAWTTDVLIRELFPPETPRRPAGGLPDGVTHSVTAGQ
jgi:AcrR family transcriptional regulator